MWAVVYKQSVVYFSESGERVVHERDKFYGDPTRNGVDILMKWPVSELNRIGLYQVVDSGPGTFDPNTQVAVQGEPIYDAGLRGVRLQYTVTNLTQEEIDARAAGRLKQRQASAYHRFVSEVSSDGTVEAALYRVICAVLKQDTTEMNTLLSVIDNIETEAEGN